MTMANEEVTREEIEAGARTIQELWPALLSAEFAKDMAYNILLAASQSRKGADGVEGELTKRAAWLLDGTKKLRFFRGRMYDDDADKYLVELHKFLADVMSRQFPSASGRGMVAEEQIADAIQKSIEKGCDITPAESLIAAQAVMVLFADNGWVLVPKEPTKEMNLAAEVDCSLWWTKGRTTPIYGHEPSFVYRAMLRALPPPPADRGQIVEECNGWAVQDGSGRMNIRTIMDTRQAAIVNWLCTDAGLLATSFTSDQLIEQAWQAKRGAADAIQVGIRALAPAQMEDKP